MKKNYEMPDGLRVYAVGDVHGCLRALERLHEEISRDLIESPPEKVHIVYIGDYVDRGPDSKGVIDFLIARQRRGDGIDKTFIKGNHEAAMLDYAADPMADQWLLWGGGETLASYDLYFEHDVPLPADKERMSRRIRDELPPEHFVFLRSLAPYVAIGDYFFTHAGIDPYKPLDNQTYEDLAYIREPFLSWHQNPDYKPLEKKVVHGHSIHKEPADLPHRVAIDTGVFESGILSCGVFEGQEVRFLQAYQD